MLNTHIKRNTKKFPLKKACGMPGGSSIMPRGSNMLGGGGAASKPVEAACPGEEHAEGAACSGD